jgi:hypothetical protein
VEDHARYVFGGYEARTAGSLDWDLSDSLMVWLSAPTVILRELNQCCIRFYASTTLVTLGFLYEVPGWTQTHNTQQDSSGRVISPPQRPLPDITTFTRESRSNTQSQQASGHTTPRLGLHGHWDRHTVLNKLHFWPVVSPFVLESFVFNKTRKWRLKYVIASQCFYLLKHINHFLIYD